MTTELGSRLREARHYVGLSQDYVAGLLNVPRSALSDMERNLRRVSVDEAQALAELYGRSLNELLTGEPDHSADDAVRALARTTVDLSSEDLEEVARFAEFLRTRSRHRSRSSL